MRLGKLSHSKMNKKSFKSIKKMLIKFQKKKPKRNLVKKLNLRVRVLLSPTESY